MLAAPGVVAGLIPWSITRWQIDSALLGWPPIRGIGAVLIAAGAAVLIGAFARFVIEGLGTPAPVAPTERLVIGGIYRYVRNPMYLAVEATIVGQALLFGKPVLLGYALGFAVVAFAFVNLYEEPTLRARYGDEYDDYRRAVPGWVPRLSPWRPEATD